MQDVGADVRTQGRMVGLLSIVAPFIAANAYAAEIDAAATTAATAAATSETTPAQSADMQEITVTAGRREESIARVPISITAVTQERMDTEAIKTVADLIRIAPGISYSSGGTNGNPSITIRGLAAAAGAATTGVYVDDVPIQARVIAYSSSSPFPLIFDLDRVEILRGPQGTLFGAGSEGGAVRFIQAKPSLTDWSGYARGEGSTIDSGSNSYEGGFAIGGPIINDTLAIRASAYFRRTGGWIDRVVGDLSVADPTAGRGPSRSTSRRPAIGKRDDNYVDASVARLALTWKPIEDLEINPSVYYQHQYQHDIGSLWWPGISNPSDGVFKEIQFLPGVDAQHMAVPQMGLNYPGTDKWTLASLNIAYAISGVQITSTSAFLSRAVDQLSDYNVSHAIAYGNRPIPYTNDYDTSDQHQRQSNWTEEIRAQNINTDGPLNVVGGFYFEHKQQRSIQGVDSNFLQLLNPYYNAVTGGAPFGDDTSAYVNYYGMGAIGPYGTQVYYANFYAIDQQEAVFAQADWKLTDRLKLTGGLRYSRNTTSFVSVYNGAENSSTAPQGHDCLPGTYLTGCVAVATGQYAVGQGPFAPAFTNSTIDASDSAITPKAGIEFQETPDDMLYVSASKGFRPGAAQGIMGAGCSAQLAQLGFKNAAGQGASPPTYAHDSVWSYEAGSKDRLFDGRFHSEFSVFYEKWTDIQASVSVSSCNQAFVTNLGGATGKGFDLDLSYDLTSQFSLGLTGGYAVISFDDLSKRGTSVVYSEGSSIPNAGPPVHATVFGDYRVPLWKDNTGYVHIDYAYTSQYRRSGNTDPLTSSYDPHLMVLPATHIGNLRVGAVHDSIDLSIFVTNLFNSTAYTYYSRTGLSYFAQTFQPRTIGGTVSYRF